MLGQRGVRVWAAHEPRRGGFDVDEDFRALRLAAQDLLLICYCPDQARAALALYRWLTYWADSEIPELARLAATIDSWHTELLAYFTTGISNGPTEAINLPIKKIKHIGHGFCNFDNYRLRLLLHYVDWNTTQATPIRGQLPTLSGVEPLFAKSWILHCMLGQAVEDQAVGVAQ